MHKVPGNLTSHLIKARRWSALVMLTVLVAAGCGGGGGAKKNSAVTTTATSVAQTIAPTTSLTSSANPSVSGESVTFTAIVTARGGSDAQSGMVRFRSGRATLGRGPLSPDGVATFTTSRLSVGHHRIFATFSGDNDSTSTSTTITQTVRRASTSTDLTSPTNPSIAGQSVTLTAAVSAATGSSIPAGEVIFSSGDTELGSGVLSASGIASFSTSSLPTGTNEIVATYPGDADFSASASPDLAQSVDAATTSTGLTSSPNPALPGQTVTLTVTVTHSPSPDRPTGTVTFKLEPGSTAVGSQVLPADGPAAFTTSSLPIGTDQIVATYSGDHNFTGSSSTAVDETVKAAPTTVGLASSVDPSASGQAVTFTATVKPAVGSGSPTGTVTFSSGDVALGSQVLSAGGTAALTTSLLPAGTHQVVAAYSGDANFATGTSTPVAQTVRPEATSVGLASSVDPSVAGLAVTFTATVKPTTGSGGPTGTVTFKLEPSDTILGTEALSAVGAAAFATSSLSPGTHEIIAVYSGDTDFEGGTSSALSQTVQRAATSTDLAGSVDPSVPGQAVTFTATVKPTTGSGTPTGTVTFKLDFSGTILGTQALSAVGTAAFTTSSLSPRTHEIIAVYSGDTDFEGGTSSALSQTVQRAATSTDLAGSVDPSVPGQAVTFTATVKPTIGTGNPTGTVTFRFEPSGATIGTGTLSATGTAAFTTSSLPAGSHHVVAVYAGDDDFTTSTSTALDQTVGTVTTRADLTASVDPSVAGQAVTFTATVQSTTGSGTPTGAVTFKFEPSGATAGTGTLSATGTAAFTTSSLPGGTHQLVAIYSGDRDFTTSTSPLLAQTVNTEATTTSLTGLPVNSSVGHSEMLTATVKPTTGPGTPTGRVTFTLEPSGSILGTSALTPAGTVALRRSTFDFGTQQIVATYSGDADFATSTSTALPEAVGRTTTSTDLTDSADRSIEHQPVTLTATVGTAGGVIPTGTVTFKLEPSGKTLGTRTLSTAGTAAVTVSWLGVGTQQIIATYSGDARFVTSTAPAVTQSVSAPA